MQSGCQGRRENVPEQCGRREEKALANCTTHRLPSSYKELDGRCEGCTPEKTLLGPGQRHNCWVKRLRAVTTTGSGGRGWRPLA